MIDIHMHLVPGVDDGAEDLERALIMMMSAGNQGIRAIFATPHSSAFDASPERPRLIFQQLCKAADRWMSEDFPEMRLFLGCELFCDPGRMPEIVEALHSGKYPTMNDTKYVLMEFSQWIMPELTIPCVETLVNAGYTPIIAHMERYKYLRGNMALVNHFRSLGALIQVNAYSLAEEMEESIKSWAQQLVMEHKADFMGTDAHRSYHRPPRAKLGIQWVYENVTADYADAIIWSNARNLLCAEPL